MTQNHKRIVQVLVRLQNKFDAIEAAWSEAADRDAAFDGGEFSGPASGRAAERECDEAARRLGFANQLVALEAAHLLGCAAGWPESFCPGYPSPLPN